MSKMDATQRRYLMTKLDEVVRAKQEEATNSVPKLEELVKVLGKGIRAGRMKMIPTADLIVAVDKHHYGYSFDEFVKETVVNGPAIVEANNRLRQEYDDTLTKIRQTVDRAAEPIRVEITFGRDNKDARAILDLISKFATLKV